MTDEQRIKNLSVPTGKVDVILDTDPCNEIDDQFAIAYLLKSKWKLNTKAFYAAPFSNGSSIGTADGMEKSHSEILKLLKMMNEDVPVFKGSTSYLPDEHTPVVSPAAKDLVERAKQYSPEHPLYIVAIAAITNIASAILLDPTIIERIVVVWLGGHALHYHDTKEFNMNQDVAAARVVMGSGVPLIQLPCEGVVSQFRLSKPDLEYWLIGKNELADYLATVAIEHAESYAKGIPWTRAIWDVTAIAWLLNDGSQFMDWRIIPTHIPTYDGTYEANDNGAPMSYVYHIRRDWLMNDLLKKLGN